MTEDPNNGAVPEGMTRYLISNSRGDFIIEIPSTWRLTFGAVNPGGPTPGRELHCVRVWEGKDKLRAVFADCRGIRDLSIPLVRKVERETGSATWTRDDGGNLERQESRTIDAEFVRELEDGPRF